MRAALRQLCLCAVLVLCAAAARGQVSVPYTEDFEGNLPGNNAWADTTFTTLNPLTRFLGNRGGGERTELRITTTPNTAYVVLFDLYIFDDWRGTRPGNSSDLFRVTRDGTVIFSESFANDDRAMSYAYPADQLGQLGFGNAQDAVFRDIAVPFTAQGQETRIAWQGQNIRSTNQQSWGIDNIRILTQAAHEASQQPGPEPEPEPEPFLPTGLTAEWYFPITASNALSNVPWDSPVLTSTVEQINWTNGHALFHPAVPANRFAVRVTGKVAIPQAGLWQFRVGSDDGSDLWINGVRVVNNDGNHGFRWREGSIQLEAGTHDLIARMFEWEGQQGFILQWRAPEQNTWETIPTTAFSNQQMLLADATAQSGFAVTTTTSSPRLASILVGDLDSDGLPDVVLTGDANPRFLRNTGSGSFVASSLGVNSTSGPAALLSGTNASLDLLLTGVNATHHALLLPFLDNAFDAAEATIIQLPAQVRALAASDLTSNGWADAVFFTPQGNLLCLHTSDPQSPYPEQPILDPGDGLNLPGDVGSGGPLASARLTPDRRQDFFYPLNGGRLFSPQSTGQFASDPLGISVHTAAATPTGAEFADFDNDGLLDLFVADPRANHRSTLWRNTPDGFVDVTVQAGLDQPGAHKSATWGDIDNDGHLDLYIVTADTTPNRLYLNNADGTFTLSQAMPPITAPGLDALFADLDNDGGLDLIVLSAAEPARLLLNTTTNDHALCVRVIGAGNRRTNAAAIGVRIDLLDEQGQFIARRDLGMARGLGGQSPLVAHFGGVDPDTTYIVRAHLARGPVDLTVVPAQVSTTFPSSGRTVPRMLTIDEATVAPPVRIIRWREVSASDHD